MQSLIEYKDGARFIGTTTKWEDLVEANGDGTSYDAELLLKKRKARPQVGLVTPGQKQIYNLKI